MVGFVGVFTQRSPVLFRRKRRILRIRGLLSAVATGNCWSQTAHTASTGPVWGFAGVASLTRPPKPHTGPHGGEFGFGPLAGACQEDCPPFRQSRVRNRAEEKTLLPAFQKSNQLSSPSHASVFQNRQKKISFLCLAVQILRCHSRTPGHMLHGIFAHKQRTRPFHGRVLMYHLILWRGRLTPPRLAPICTPRPLGWAGSCTGAHRFVLCRLFPGRWSFLCR